jgi:hypothetical protein
VHKIKHGTVFKLRHFVIIKSTGPVKLI